MSAAWPCPLWLISGVAVGAILSRLLRRRDFGHKMSVASPIVIVALFLAAVVPPIAADIGWWLVGPLTVHDVVWFIGPALLGSVGSAMTSATLLGLLASGLAARLGHRPPEMARRIGVVVGGAAFVPAYAVSAFILIGMGLTG